MDNATREAVRRKDHVGVIRAHLKAGILSQAALERSIALACPVATDYAKEDGLGHLVYRHPCRSLDIDAPTDRVWRTLAPWVAFLSPADAYQWGIDRLRYWGERYRMATATNPSRRWDEALAYSSEVQGLLERGKLHQAYRMSRVAWDHLMNPRDPLGPMTDSVRDMLVACDIGKLLEHQALAPHMRVQSVAYLHNRVTEAVTRLWYCPTDSQKQERARRAGQRMGSGIWQTGIWQMFALMDRDRWETPRLANLHRCMGLRTLGWYTLDRETRRVIESIDPRHAYCGQYPDRARPSPIESLKFIGSQENIDQKSRDSTEW